MINDDMLSTDILSAAMPLIDKPSWFTAEGLSSPLGVSYIPEEDAYNFALYSKSAAKVTLLFYRKDDYVNPVVSYIFNPLINKSQRIWHHRIPRAALNGATFYAYQVEGHLGNGPDYWHRFDPEKILLDPYAKEVFFPPAFSRGAAARKGSNAGKAPLGFICTGQEEFDWQGDKKVRHEHDLVIYEMHVRGFTRQDTSIEESKRGTFAGVIEKIPYLKALGITAVELMPVHQFDPREGNYWGYMPLNFFAPHHSYAEDQSPGGAIREFKTMVRELHKAGIEVILDVVFNHTTEGGRNGPCYHLKGIDNSTYYLMRELPDHPYIDHSGTGNTLRTDHPAVQRMIMDSLRYWVNVMHVDGFRFDLASIFTRRSDGTVGEAPIFANIEADPDLADIRLIAEPWDADGLFQLGRAFPGISWRQWNGRFRDDVRRFVKSDAGLSGVLAEKIYGSDHFFPDDIFHAYRPYQSINYINAHDGFTLYDQVAYNQKRNQANGQNNQDGHEPNYSWNCGWEGDQGVPVEVMQLRMRQAKNLFALLMLSNGTPMFYAGDEFLHTQGGNNNPYNQDNTTSWLDWQRLARMQDHFGFVQKLIAFRKQHHSLGRSRFWRQDVKWYGPDGFPDFSPSSRSLAFYLSGASVGDDDLYVMINSHWENRNFIFMEPGPWFRIINTLLAPPDDFVPVGQEEVLHPEYLVGPRSVAVFVKTRNGSF